MNYSAITNTVGLVLKFEAALMTLPCIVSAIYREKSGFAFVATIFICYALGTILQMISKKTTMFYAREGFVAVALSWLALSFFGCLPFYLSKEIPSLTDALFETISGFTTTGSSILTDVEALSRCMTFWRCFTNWIGGMGVLVFVLAVMPMTGGYNMHLMRAESPGPQVGKLVPRVRSTAMILYAIYIAITVIEFILLLCGKMPVFDAINTSLATAGTGGFAILNSSMGSYSPYLQYVVATFMILFGVNFNVYYLILIRKAKKLIHSEEVMVYLLIIIAAVFAITLNIRSCFTTLEEAFRQALFQVGSIITTTGFATADFDLWPEFSKMIMVLLMFGGACAGSTGGGIKVSRIILFVKMLKREIHKFIHPRSVKQIKLDGRNVDSGVLTALAGYITAYAIIFVISILVISLEENDFVTNFTAVASCFNNIGPGLAKVGPTANFSFFSDLGKFVLMFDMLAGRLELFPMLILFSYKTWRK